MGQKKINNKDLKSALDHLWYEIFMLHESYIELNKISSQREFNFFIEIFLLHSRNLIYFFEDKKYDSDIRCSNFGTLKEIIKLPKYNNLIIINRFLSHLTWDRVKSKKPAWDLKIIETIKQNINKSLINFINKLSDNLFPTTKYRKSKKDFISLMD